MYVAVLSGKRCIISVGICAGKSYTFLYHVVLSKSIIKVYLLYIYSRICVHLENVFWIYSAITGHGLHKNVKLQCTSLKIYTI